MTAMRVTVGPPRASPDTRDADGVEASSIATQQERHRASTDGVARLLGVFDGASLLVEHDRLQPGPVDVARPAVVPRVLRDEGDGLLLRQIQRQLAGAIDRRAEPF